MVWLTWIGVPLLAILVGLRAGLVAGSLLGIVVGLAILGIGVAAQVLYLRWFPHISGWMGYGSVADTAADSGSLANPAPHVTFYTASVCPFCPIMRRRLAELQGHGRFDVQEIDVTFRPELVRAKGLRCVPVLEAHGQFLVGNATSAQITEFLATAVGEPPSR